MTSLFSKVAQYVRRNPKISAAIAGGIIVTSIALFNVLGTPTETPPDTKREVTVARVIDLMNGGTSVSGVAEIRSVNEAKISPESGGRVIRVRAALGDHVSAGQILAEMENASQRAAVVQAEGSYDAAKAALKKVQGGTREEQLSILQSAVSSAKGTAVNALLSAYATVDSAINDTADQMFTGVESGQIQFTPSTSNQQREVDLEQRRGTLVAVDDRQESSSQTVSLSSDLKHELQKTEDEVRLTRTFIDILLTALADAIDSPTVDSSDITAYKSDATSARTSLTTALAGITAARNSLQTAEKNLEQGETGAQSEDVDAAEAIAKQAQGAYNSAVANLEKTIIRSPISGTLNNFTIKLGDFLAPAQQVAVVSNNGALEAVAYVTEEDKGRVAIGQEISLQGGVVGTITKIAPALDPVTRRIEIRINLPETATNTLTNGQSVRIEFAANAVPTVPTGPLSIPITALKIQANRTIVFTVENDTIVAKEITIGKLSGSSVQVIEGLFAETEIVTDARGLKEGDEVTVNSQ